MNKLDILFEKKQKDILSIYFTAGYPNLHDTKEIIDNLEKNGVDLIEIGIPFSDPIADGPLIQFSNSTSIENGMSLKTLFAQLKLLGNDSKIPKILMGYFNPILKFGVEEFCEECQNTGIDGVIIPDLPIFEYESKYKSIFKTYGIHFIFLVSPQTSLERLNKIEKLSTSFIYAVSTNSTTGGVVNFNSQKDYFQRLKNNFSKPFLIGFGVRDSSSYNAACTYANGAIIGSAFIKALSDKDEIKQVIKKFISQIR